MEVLCRARILQKNDFYKRGDLEYRIVQPLALLFPETTNLQRTFHKIRKARGINPAIPFDCICHIPQNDFQLHSDKKCFVKMISDQNLNEVLWRKIRDHYPGDADAV